MLRLNSKDLPDLTQESLDYLSSRQSEINLLPSIQEKAERAISLWSGKSRASFAPIKKRLIEMCVGVEICVYCENNEATDIEHIYPKKIYPEKAFIWDNYVLACNKCNSHHKSDKFKIFNPRNSATTQDVTPPRGTYAEPANDDALFLNQRADDPMDFIKLDLIERTFIFTEIANEGTREYERAKFTIELLGLNSRGALVAARRNAALFFISRLEKYVAAKKSADFQELKNVLNDDFGSINETVNFIQERERMLQSIKKDVMEYSHPTVWRELVRQRASLPKTNGLLNDAPEAINW